MAEVPALRERADLPEEDLDLRGGGQLHDEHRRCGGMFVSMRKGALTYSCLLTGGGPHI